MGIAFNPATLKYARCVENSKRVRWDIDKDVIRGRKLNFSHKFLPDGLSRIDEFPCSNEREAVFISQIQGRTYANIFGLVERFINAKVLEISQDYWVGDQIALEALVRFSDEELKHQELFRRMEALCAEGMPDGYQVTADPDAVATTVLSMSSWAVLGLTLHIELFTQAHYLESIQQDEKLSALYKDVFRFHWLEESQHAALDELEWIREDQRLTEEQRDRAVNDFIALVAAVDGILQQQAKADCNYFIEHCARNLTALDVERFQLSFVSAYRWQYIFSGVQVQRFMDVLTSLVTAQQMQRIEQALTSLATTPVAV